MLKPRPVMTAFDTKLPTGECLSSVPTTTSLFITQAKSRLAATGTPMDRTVARKELSQSVEAALAGLEASLSELRTTGQGPKLIAELQQIVEEIRRTFTSIS